MEKSTLDILWVAISAVLVFLMQAGFLCLESGLTRSKNNINVAIKNLSDLGLAVFIFFVIGFGLMFGESLFGLIGTSQFLPKIESGEMWPVTFFLYEAMFCSTAVTIISGAVAERMRFTSYLLLGVVVAGLIYPVFGHWAWNGLDAGVRLGWLGVWGFYDFAGSTAVHSVGGWVALAAVLVIGPRTGRFPEGGKPLEIPASSLPIAILGTLLLWFGWFGFNGGSALGMNSQVPAIISNTLLAGATGLLVTMIAGLALWGYADVRLVINGSLAGLVAITAGANAVGGVSALVIGGIGGLVMLAVSRLLERLRIDDAVGAVPVHLGAGIWGTLAVALFGRPEVLGSGLSWWEQLGAQLLGVVVCGVWAFGLAYLFLKLISPYIRLRVSAHDEQIGLNVSEHGARTELLDLVQGMDLDVATPVRGRRVPVEPFTEIGIIAERYNRVMDSLEDAERALLDSHGRMEDDLNLATEFQRALLPEFPRTHFLQCASLFLPYAGGVSGDVYDVMLNRDGDLNVFVGDATGHGISAALMTMMAQMGLDSMRGDLPADETLRRLNQLFASRERGRTLTAAYLRITSDGALRTSNAGHPPTLVVLKAGNGVEEFGEGGCPLGMFQEEVATYVEQHYQLQPGDTVFVFTDGITEWKNPNDEDFGLERLKQFLQFKAGDPLESILKSLFDHLTDFAVGRPCDDDLTILGMRYQPA